MKEYQRAIDIDPNYISARAKLDLLRDAKRARDGRPARGSGANRPSPRPPSPPSRSR